MGVYERFRLGRFVYGDGYVGTQEGGSPGLSAPRGPETAPAMLATVSWRRSTPRILGDYSNSSVGRRLPRVVMKNL